MKRFKKVITIIITLAVLTAASVGVVYGVARLTGVILSVTVEAKADNAFVGPVSTATPEPTPTETPTPTTEPTPTAKTAKATVAASSGAGQYLGTFDISYYTCDPAENGGSNLTATGAVLSDVVGVCIAADPSVLPFGTRVYIDGIGDRVVMDCGGAIHGNKIDVLVASDADIPAYGRTTMGVYAK